MKTTIALLIVLGTAFTVGNTIAGDTASCCTAKTAALSPRAQANQTVVVAGNTDGDVVRTDLGTGARSKAFGGHTSNFARTSAKDVDLIRGRNNLGVAAREKATGATGSRTFQIAPLK